MRLIIALKIFGALYTIFLGFFAVRIFVFQGQKPFPKGPRPSWQWWVFQFVFNSSCCALGWAIAILYVQRIRCDPANFSFSGADAVPVIVSLLGVTGLLPRALYAFSSLTGEISRKVASAPESTESNSKS